MITDDTNAVYEDGVGGSSTTGGNVLSNDIGLTDPAVTGIITVQSGITQNYSIASGQSIIIAGIYGTLTIGSDGSYSYELDNSNATLQALPPNTTVSDQFQYITNDPSAPNGKLTINVTSNFHVLDTVVYVAEPYKGVDILNYFSDPDFSLFLYQRMLTNADTNSNLPYPSWSDSDFAVKSDPDGIINPDSFDSSRPSHLFYGAEYYLLPEKIAVDTSSTVTLHASNSNFPGNGDDGTLMLNRVAATVLNYHYSGGAGPDIFLLPDSGELDPATGEVNGTGTVDGGPGHTMILSDNTIGNLVLNGGAGDDFIAARGITGNVTLNGDSGFNELFALHVTGNVVINSLSSQDVFRAADISGNLTISTSASGFVQEYTDSTNSVGGAIDGNVQLDGNIFANFQTIGGDVTVNGGNADWNGVWLDDVAGSVTIHAGSGKNQYHVSNISDSVVMYGGGNSTLEAYNISGSASLYGKGNDKVIGHDVSGNLTMVSDGGLMTTNNVSGTATLSGGKTITVSQTSGTTVMEGYNGGGATLTAVNTSGTVIMNGLGSGNVLIADSTSGGTVTMNSFGSGDALIATSQPQVWGGWYEISPATTLNGTIVMNGSDSGLTNMLAENGFGGNATVVMNAGKGGADMHASNLKIDKLIMNGSDAGDTFSLSYYNFTNKVINGGGGNDTVTLLDAPIFFNTTVFSAIIDGGPGTDNITVFPYVGRNAYTFIFKAGEVAGDSINRFDGSNENHGDGTGDKLELIGYGSDHTLTYEGDSTWRIDAGNTHEYFYLYLNDGWGYCTFNPLTDVIWLSQPHISQVVNDLNGTAIVPNHGTSNDTTPIVRVDLGSAPNTAPLAGVGYTVQLFDGGVPLGAPITLTAADISARHVDIQMPVLADGLHNFTAAITDMSDHTSPASDAYQVTVDPDYVDTTPPGAPTITDAAVNGNGYVNTAIQTLSGSAEPYSTIDIYDGGATPIGTVTADASGGWSYITGALAEGAYSFTATATDAAGNTSDPSEALVFTVDLSSPAAPSITDAAVNGNDYVNAAIQTLSGSAEPGSSVTLYDGDATPIGTVTADATTGAWTYDTAPLTDGVTYSFTATATDAAGNTGDLSDTMVFTVDLSSPTAPSITDAAVNGNGYVNAAIQTLSGSAEPGSSVTLYDGDATPIGTVTADATTGAWTYDTAPLTDGVTYSFTATATDATGNTGPASSPLSFIVDLTAPSAPVIASVSTSSGLLTAMNNYTNNANLTVKVTLPATGSLAAAGDTLRLYNGTSQLLGAAYMLTATDIANGYANVPTGPLSDGIYAIATTITDAADNQSDVSNSFTVIEDSIAPAMPVVTSETLNKVGSITLTGKAEANSTINLSVNGTAITSAATADSNGNWSFKATGLNNVVNTFTDLKAADQAGNISPTNTAKIIYGSTNSDTISGSQGNDLINAGGGNDLIFGGAGKDTLTGGNGKDTFAYQAAADSTNANLDTITDFIHGSDKIDFTNIAGITAANVAAAAALASNATTIAAHSVGWLSSGSGNNAVTTIYVNTTNHSEPLNNTDMKIILTGIVSLTASDFHHN